MCILPEVCINESYIESGSDRDSDRDGDGDGDREREASVRHQRPTSLVPQPARHTIVRKRSDHPVVECAESAAATGWI